MTDDLDAVVRLRAFDFLTEQRRRFAKRRSLARSSSVGIFKPAILPELPHLHGIVQGIYEPQWPVFIVEDHPEALSFIVAIDDQVGRAGRLAGQRPGGR